MSHSVKVDVASRVRKRRLALTLTQEELARELGVTHQHISRIERGHAVPSLELLVRLSDRLGVSTDYVLTGHETARLDTTGAIRSDPSLTPVAKRHLIGVIAALKAADGPTKRMSKPKVDLGDKEAVRKAPGKEP